MGNTYTCKLWQENTREEREKRETAEDGKTRKKERVETSGVEPETFRMRSGRATSCAISPHHACTGRNEESEWSMSLPFHHLLHLDFFKSLDAAAAAGPPLITTTAAAAGLLLIELLFELLLPLLLLFPVEDEAVAAAGFGVHRER